MLAKSVEGRGYLIDVPFPLFPRVRPPIHANLPGFLRNRFVSLSEREARAFAELLDADPVGGTGDGSISMGKWADMMARRSFDDGQGSTVD